VRDVVVGEQVQSMSLFSAYNIDIPRDLLRKDPELAPLLNESNFWLGHGKIVRRAQHARPRKQDKPVFGQRGA